MGIARQWDVGTTRGSRSVYTIIRRLEDGRLRIIDAGEFVEPVPDDYFIWWLFKHRCIMCNHPATEINEIVPRSRSKESIRNWKNRVTLCQKDHREFHADGVTNEKIEQMKKKRLEFLKMIGRDDYS